MVSINDSKVTGNTFIAVVMAAFDLDDQRQVTISHDLNFNGFGSVQVNGEWFDWFKDGETTNFMEA